MINYTQSLLLLLLLDGQNLTLFSLFGGALLISGVMDSRDC